jgi:hypothetical protein
VQFPGLLTLARLGLEDKGQNPSKRGGIYGAVIVIHDVPGATHEMMEDARQADLIDKLKAAPGFKGHWSGPTDSGYRVIERWESPDDWRAWYKAMVKPNMPPSVEAAEPTFIDLAEVIEPS